MINSRLVTMLVATSLLAGWYVWQDGVNLFGLLPGRTEVVAPPPAPAAPDAPAAPGQPVHNPLQGLSAAQLADIAARPLFNPTRAPRPAPEPVVEAQPPTPDNPQPQAQEVNPADYELLAIGGGGGGRTAVVRFAPQNRIYHLRKGQFLAEWQVDEIADRSVKLAHDNKSFEITMFKPPAEAQAPAGKGSGQVAPDDASDQPPPDAVPGNGNDQPPTDSVQDAPDSTQPQ